MHNLASFAITYTLVCASFVSAAPVTEDPLENQNLFEGDLDIPEEMIQLYYGESNDTIYDESNSTNGTIAARTTRAATSDLQRLWPGGIVHYSFHSNVTQSLRSSIRKAMDRWENTTCLRFVARMSARDYIEFTSVADGCSSYVGRQGGRQLIKLKNPGCTSFGIILHEIAHAVGFWHEQSRPDRDNYVRILRENIESGRAHNFQKRSHHSIDSQGVSYDYGSIMHYSTTAFSDGEPTIAVTNDTEYARQGQPNIGQRLDLSQGDIEQANRLYHCHNSGIRGILKIHIRNATNLPGWLNDSDPYVRITAVDSEGRTISASSSTKRGTRSPNWNQWINMGGREWQFFQLGIWDADGLSGDDAIFMSQTVPLRPGYHSLTHCVDTSCHGRMYFAYNLTEDGNECSPQPCQNGGTCIDRIATFNCYCRSGYTGIRCQYRTGNLRFYAWYGRDLPDRDRISNDSNPYLEIVAHDHFGNSVRKTTRTIGGDGSPDWNQWLQFGTRVWSRFYVQVWDSDLNADDALSSRYVYYLSSSDASRIDVRQNAYSGGYVYFTYYY